MAILQCEMCCGEVDILTDSSVGKCKYCGSRFTIPKEIEKKGNLFNRANYLRQNCSFDKAIEVYESILADDCEDADAMWGLVLCRYGIEFVEDPATRQRIPTCHRASRTSILLDPDFKSAVRYADEEKRGVYYEQATRIDRIQKEILSLSEREEKYDVFICYKETDELGERTLDSTIAHEIYNELTKLNIKTFFARKTLEGKLGSSYEPIIYSALSSARVMIVVGTRPEYFEAIWVKNEWSRYLGFMKESGDKHLIPAYRNMTAYDLPEEFMSIQALDMSRIGFKLDLCDAVKKMLGLDNKSAQTSASSPVSKNSLYSRAMVFLENREFYKAIDYFDRVLDIDPQFSKAYWGSLLASYQCADDNELVGYANEDWTEDVRLKNAMKFASEEELNSYEAVLAKRVQSIKQLSVDALTSKEFERSLYWCNKYLEYYPEDGEAWRVKLFATNKAANTGELYDVCMRHGRPLEETEEYVKAIKYSNEEERRILEQVVHRISVDGAEILRRNAYTDCKEYMYGIIHSMENRKKDREGLERRDRITEVNAIGELVRTRGDFFGNNIFELLIQAIFWAIPTYFGVVLAQPEGGIWNSFGIAYGVIMAIVLITKAIKYKTNVEQLNDLRSKHDYAINRIIKDHEAIELLQNHKAKATAVYERFLDNPQMSLEDIKKEKEEFGNMFLNIVKDKK